MSDNASPETTTASPAPVRAKRRWWWPQFGLRTLLVAMLVMGGAGGILVRWIDWHNRQRAMKLLIAEGFDLASAPEAEEPSHTGWPTSEAPATWDKVVDVSHGTGANVTPETLNAITRLSNLQSLYVYRPYSIPLPSLASLRSLRRLVIDGAAIHPADAKRIAECENLASLTIEVDHHSSRDLAVLDRLKHLRSLRIDGPLDEEVVVSWRFSSLLEELRLDAQDLSSETLADLVRRNRSPRQVELRNANCTLEVCKALSECKSLKHLRLFDCEIDDGGLAELHSRQLEELNILEFVR